MKIELYNRECLEKLKELPDDSVDAIVTDPPYFISFMNKGWDNEDSIASKKEFWAECLRVTKPGGYLLAFGHSRTHHRLFTAVEDGGWEIRDTIMWLYGSGFPKSLNIGKAIDKLKGSKRKVVGKKIGKINMSATKKGDTSFYENAWQDKNYIDLDITKGSSDWEGWGTALKPAHEPICMARKPLSEKSVAENVLKWRTGGINIDACRVGTETISTHNAPKGTFAGGEPERGSDTSSYTEHEGRFPANIILDEEAATILDEQSGITKGTGKPVITQAGIGGGVIGKHDGRKKMPSAKTGLETIRSIGDSGGASRFFYCAKVSSKERNAGCDDLEKKEWKKEGAVVPNRKKRPFNPVQNNHPTVKPIALMEYLIKLVSKEEATILDPFMGSGSTGIAAKKLNRNFIGIEMDEGYYTIASKRIGE